MVDFNFMKGKHICRCCVDDIYLLCGLYLSFEWMIFIFLVDCIYVKCGLYLSFVDHIYL